jgi:hypothetical protein
MFTLPEYANDDDLVEGVVGRFKLVASGATSEADEYLDFEGALNPLRVSEFIDRVALLTNGGRLHLPPEPTPSEEEGDSLSIDGPAPIVCRWIPGPDSTEKYPGFIADIIHAIPVDGQWSSLDASFFVRANAGRLLLQLRDVFRLED